MDLLLFWPLWSLLSHTHTNTRTRTHARSTKQYFFMESCVAWAAPSASASASRHALHLCPVRGLEAYYPLSSKWPHVPALRLSTSSHLLSETGSVSRNRQKNKEKKKRSCPPFSCFQSLRITREVSGQRSPPSVRQRACWGGGGAAAVCPSVNVSDPLIFCRL